jgi:serine/threonine protein kinase
MSLLLLHKIYAYLNMSRKIGSGTYGCVYKPPVSCNDPCDKDICKSGVSKVSKIRDVQGEYEADQLMKIYDPQNSLHYPIEHVCDVKPELVKDCSNLFQETQTGKSSVELGAMFYRDGGITINKYIENPITTDFYVYLGKLIQDVIILNSQQVQHRDIKLENIVVQDRKTYIDIRLIDFGLVTSISEEDNDPIYMADYFIWPLEIYLLAVEKPSLENFKHVVSVLNSRIVGRNKHLKFYGLPTYTSAEQIFNGIPIYSDLDVVNLTKRVSQIVDEYSLGFALGELAYRINISRHKTQQDQLMANALSYLGVNLTKPNLISRMSLDQAYKHYLYYLTIKCTNFKQPIYHLVNTIITSEEIVLKKLITRAENINKLLQQLKQLYQTLDNLVTDWNLGPRQYLIPDPIIAISYHIAKTSGDRQTLIKSIYKLLF